MSWSIASGALGKLWREADGAVQATCGGLHQLPAPPAPSPPLLPQPPSQPPPPPPTPPPLLPRPARQFHFQPPPPPCLRFGSLKACPHFPEDVFAQVVIQHRTCRAYTLQTDMSVAWPSKAVKWLCRFFACSSSRLDRAKSCKMEKGFSRDLSYDFCIVVLTSAKSQ